MLNLAPAKSDDASKAKSGSSHTLYCLIGWYALAVVSGIRTISTSDSLLDLLLPFAFAACLGSWVVADARRRGHAIPMLSQGWVYIFAIVVAPAYLVWSRKWRGVGWLLLNFVAWYAVAVASFLIAGRIMFGAAWLRF